MGILNDKLNEYGSSDFYPYHMPGHKRREVEGFPRQVTNLDITEIADFDNLHQAQGLVLKAQQSVARAYGVEESFFLINGSTCGILSAISAAVPFGGHLLIARNCHKSVYHGAYLRQLKLSYIYPQVNKMFDICEAVTPKQVEEMLLADESIQAVLIVSPTYEGRIADVRGIAEVVHSKGIPLIVDEAHGAHLGFDKDFATNSGRLGADLVINSVHKTLPAMTQTALLHCSGTLINRDKLKQFLHIYQSSSPSYIMMASIEQAVQTAVQKKELFKLFKERWSELHKKLQGLQRIKVLYEEPERKSHDMGKLIISTKGTKLSGKQLSDMLRQKYHLEMEMACETYVLAMFTIADTLEGYERLARALLEIDAGLEQSGVKLTDETGERGFVEEAMEENRQQLADQPSAVEGLEQSTKGIPLFQAWDGEKEAVPLAQAQGRITGEFINLYPPGTPIAVPGERVNAAMIRQICNCLKCGLEIQGLHKDTQGGYANICCLKEV